MALEELIEKGEMAGDIDGLAQGSKPDIGDSVFVPDRKR